MLTKWEWVHGPGQGLTERYRRDVAAIQIDLDEQIARVWSQARDQWPGLDLELQRAHNAVEAARLAQEAATRARAIAERALLDAKAEPHQREDALRRTFGFELQARENEYHRALEEQWFEYVKSTREEVRA